MGSAVMRRQAGFRSRHNADATACLRISQDTRLRWLVKDKVHHPQGQQGRGCKDTQAVRLLLRLHQARQRP